MCKTYRKNLTGQKFGRLTVIKWDKERSIKDSKRNYWICKCNCGNPNTLSICQNNLKTKATQSCGCLQKERAIKASKKYNTYNLEGVYGIGYTKKGEEFYFDLEDYNKIKNYCWYKYNRGYIGTKIDQKIILLHRFVINVKENQVVDHINHNKTDNRKENLRTCTQSNNQMNRRKQKNNKTGKTGVSFIKDKNQWMAQIIINNKTINLGYFNDFNQAIKFREEAEEKYFGRYKYNKEEDFLDVDV